MITRNGSDAPRPSWLPKRPTSAWPMPIANPAAVAMGNERKSPTSAAAMRGEDQSGHRGDLQRDDRYDEDAGGSGDGRAERPVLQGDPVGRQADRGSRSFALRHRLGGEAELAGPVEQPQPERRRAADGEQDQAVGGDADVAPQRHAIGRQPTLDLTWVRPVAQHDGRLHRDEHAERGDHPHQGARPAERAHHHPVGERAEERRPGDAGDRRHQERPPGSFVQFPLHEDAGDRGRTEREVQHAGAAVDHDQALGGQRVQRADAEAQQRESDDFVHRPPLADPPRCVAKHQSGRRVPDRTSRSRRALGYSALDAADLR